MCYTNWCIFEERTGPNDTKCTKPVYEKCPLDEDFDFEEMEILEGNDNDDNEEDI